MWTKLIVLEPGLLSAKPVGARGGTFFSIIAATVKNLPRGKPGNNIPAGFAWVCPRRSGLMPLLRIFLRK